MAELSISLPSDLQRLIDDRVAGGRYLDAGDYLRDLLRRDRDGLERPDDGEDAEMRALVAEGFASGVSHHTPEQVLDRVIAGLRARS